MNEIAIKVADLTKIYKLYDKPSDRLKEALGLTKKVRYREHYALNHVSFDVYKGETVGIIGTNGSGKSTILKIITGVLNPSGGEVKIEGRISALLELGAGFNMEYTGLENVYLNGTMIGFSKEEIDAKLEDILNFADIGDFIHQPVKNYSSGMFVRLAFAVAINIDPEILIVDEALSVGDVFFQAKCYQKFEEFKQKGKTILFVSHDLSSISKYCDRVVLLNKGDKLAEGAARDMVNLYKKVLVHQDEAPEDKEKKTTPEHKPPFELNPNRIEYGSRDCEIIDFSLLDCDGVETNSIEKFTEFTIKETIRFNKPVRDPIITYTIKDLKGADITGTNTMYEKIPIPEKEAGETIEVSFKQRMNLQGGEYLLSLGCTGFVDGEFTVYHRRYDLCNITVVSDKNTVGFFDMDSKVEVRG